MENSESKGDDDDVTPEALILEATASRAVVTEKNKAEKLHEDDDEEKLLASVPPELSRATARNVALQPGAFRDGGRINANDEDFADTFIASAMHLENHEFALNSIGDNAAVVATLVIESDTPSPADDIPVYKGEPMEEKPKDVVAIQRKWIWRIIIAGCCMLCITGVSIGRALSLRKQSEGLEDELDNATHSENIVYPPSSAPTRISLEPFDRFTHHVALMDFVSAASSCSLLQDRYIEHDEEQDVAGTVKITCGDRHEGKQQHDDDDGNAALVVHDMQNCTRLGNDSISCLVGHKSQHILFTCGTHSEHYLDSTKTPTASVQVEETLSVCNAGDDANTSERDDSGLPPVVSIFLTVGRLCQAEPMFQFANSACVGASNEVVSGVNNATYCVQMRQPCTTPECGVILDEFLTLDSNTDAACEVDNLDSSTLYDDLISTSFRSEIAELQRQQETFVKAWLDETIV